MFEELFLQENIFECNGILLDKISTEPEECCETEIDHRIAQRKEHPEEMRPFHRWSGRQVAKDEEEHQAAGFIPIRNLK